MTFLRHELINASPRTISLYFQQIRFWRLLEVVNDLDGFSLEIDSKLGHKSDSLNAPNKEIEILFKPK